MRGPTRLSWMLGSLLIVSFLLVAGSARAADLPNILFVFADVVERLDGPGAHHVGLPG